ncbi:MAG: septum site-determining protein MinD [Oscillospiraceae bacterium]|nr:septum site-determining protein MinD [Oscillospiraceae bacterium]
MAEIICIASGKGGTGKTSLSAGLSCSLAKMGHSVLVVDMDIGLRNLDLVLGITEHALFDFTDVLLSRATLKEAATPHPEIEGLFFLAAPLGIPEDEITTEAFLTFAAEAKETYDFCILDCPAGIGDGFRQAACAADRAIVVATPDQTSLRDAQMTRFALMEQGVEDVQLVVNRISRGVHAMPIDEIIDRTGIRFLGAVPEDRTVIAAANRGELVIAKPRSAAAKAYQNIAQRVLGVGVPLLRRVRSIR